MNWYRGDSGFVRVHGIQGDMGEEENMAMILQPDGDVILALGDATMKRKCPGPTCETFIDRRYVFCRPHWYALTQRIRDDIWATYRAVPGEPAHIAALREGIAYLRDKAARLNGTT